MSVSPVSGYILHNPVCIEYSYILYHDYVQLFNYIIYKSKKLTRERFSTGSYKGKTLSRDGNDDGAEVMANEDRIHQSTCWDINRDPDIADNFYIVDALSRSPMTATTSPTSVFCPYLVLIKNGNSGSAWKIVPTRGLKLKTTMLSFLL